MTILPRNKQRCGYSKRFLLKCPSITENVLRIKAKTNVSGVPVETVAYADFDSKSFETKSFYNPPSIRMTLTRVSNGYALISNITFVNTTGIIKTIQFLCVDGSNLQSYQYEDSDLMINMVNEGQLPPIVIPDLINLDDTTLSKVDAYAASIWNCLFLWEILGRVGLIDDSHVCLMVLNVPMANAFWNGHFAVIGSGVETGAPSMKPLSSLDVIGHEFGHAVIEALGNLEYQGESGALNESIADIFGTCLEKYFDIRGDRSLFDWDLGEDFLKGNSRAALRSLSNPKMYEQPDTYKGKYWFDTRRQEDQGGVHFNSGVSNYFYYCAATGKKGTNDNGTNYDIKDPFEMFKLAKFIYLSLKGGDGYQKITQYSTYSQYANCLMANVNKFITDNGLDAKLADSVKEGLIAVGVVQRESEPPIPPDGPEDPDPEWPEEPGPEEPWPSPQDPTPQPWPIPTPWPQPSPCPCPQPNPYPVPQNPFPFPLPDWLPPIGDWFPQFPQFPLPQFPWATAPGCGQLTTHNPNSFRGLLSVGVNVLKAKFGFASRYPSNAYSMPMARAPVRQSRFTSLRNRFGF